MLLQCEREGGIAEDGATLAAGWLRAGVLDSLIELNELCLSLLAEQATVRGGPPSGLMQLGELWRGLDAAARLLLGMPAPSATVIAHYTLPQIQALAASHPDWLRPRWPARVQVWRELLLAASGGESPVLERARLRGLTLLAAEARLASAAGGSPSDVRF